MTLAASTLHGWMSTHHVTQRDLAEVLGVKQSQISRWLNGKSRPEIIDRLKIERYTYGTVKHLQWLTEEEERDVRSMAPLTLVSE